MANDLALTKAVDRQPIVRVRKSAFRRWWMKTRWMHRKAGRILTPRELIKLIGGTNIWFIADEVLSLIGEATYDVPPRLIKGWRTNFDLCFVIFVGMDETHWSGWPNALVVAKILGIDAILMETPPEGLKLTVDEAVDHYRWLPDLLNGRPFYVYAFSKGGFDALWLMAATGLTKQCRRFRGLSVPLRGTRLAAVKRGKGKGGKAAEELLPGSTRVAATNVLLQKLHDEEGLDVVLGGAIMDIVCPRSNCRPENVSGYRPPPWWQILRPRLTHFLRAKWYSPPGEPWYWCHSLFHVGHTAIYNLFLAFFAGLDALRLARRETENPERR